MSKKIVRRSRTLLTLTVTLLLSSLFVSSQEHELTYGEPQVAVVGSDYRVPQDKARDFGKQVYEIANGLGLEGAHEKDGRSEYEIYDFIAKYWYKESPGKVALIKAVQNGDIYALTWYEGGSTVKKLRLWDEQARERLAAAGYQVNSHFEMPMPKIYAHYAIMPAATQHYRSVVQAMIQELGLQHPPPPWIAGDMSHATVPDLTYFYNDKKTKAFEQWAAHNFGNPREYASWVIWYRQSNNEDALRLWNTELEQRVLVVEGVTLISDTDHPEGEKQAH